MPRSRCSPHPVPPATLPPDELLDVVAQHLVQAHMVGETDDATLVRLRLTADGVDLDLRPLPAGVHPVDALVGTTVGPGWAAIGLLADGVAHPVEGRPSPTPAPGHGTGTAGARVVLAILVDRHDHVTHLVAPRPPDRLPDHPQAPEGRLVDVLRRSLGLATPAPAGPSGPWWAALWLDRIVAALAEDPTARRTLVDLGSLHPLVGPGLSARDATVLHRIAPASSTAGWEVMRRAVAAQATGLRSERAIRQALVPLVSPAQARWFDQGSFSRWLEAVLPPRPVLLAATDALLPPPLARALRDAVAE